MAMQARTFEDSEAVRSRVPLWVAIVSPSGAGKTYSALRLATGIQRVAGGDIWGIDSEAKRMLHYADDFRFRHLPFAAPFSPDDYLQAIEHCVRKGARTVIVDSASHEHEGAGGVLEMHTAETDRLVKAWNSTPDAVTMAAWKKPKSRRRGVINALMQLPVNFIFCFRAKDKLKPNAKGKPEKIGWMPIAGEEWIYEMTIKALLLPMADGVPEWQPARQSEKEMVKIPKQFRDLFASKHQLCEDDGEFLARWAEGIVVLGEIARTLVAEVNAADEAGLKALRPRIEGAGKDLNKGEVGAIRNAVLARREVLAGAKQAVAKPVEQVNEETGEVSTPERQPGDET